MKRKSHLEIWNQVWIQDSYSVPQLREKKAKRKIELLLEFLPQKINSNTTILDAGCGGGYVSEFLLKETDATVVAFDQSDEALRICERLKVYERFVIKQSDACNIPYEDESVDLVLCLGLLEHVRDYEQCISEIERTLCKEGYVYIVSSNRCSVMFLQWLWKHFNGSWKYGYQKNWTPMQLKQIMEKHDFETLHMEVIEGWGDHDRLSKVDVFLRKKLKFVGRYIVYLGKKK